MLEGGADVSKLDRLMFPRRVAIAGLSARPRAWGQMAYRFLRAGGFDGDVLAYRPNHEEPGVEAFDDFGSVGPVDLLVVAVPAAAAVGIVADASAAGVGSAVVFSSGFAEDGAEGAELQRRLVDAAGPMPMLGPNCLGLVSAPGNVVVSVSAFLNRPRRNGPVALVSQSGAMGFILAEHLRRRGVGFSFYASTGNEAALGAADLVAYVSARPEVKVVGCYLEGVRDVEAWRSACRGAREAGCQVVALKVGRSEAAQRAALSHTASAAGEAEMFEAAARDDGVTVVGDEESFAEAVTALSRPVVLPSRPGLAVITMSGGGGAMISDQLRSQALVPPLSDSSRGALRSLGIPLAGDSNPVDLTGMFFANLDRLDEVISAVAADEAVDATVLYFTFGDQMVDAYRALAATLADRPDPAWLVWAGAPEGEVEGQASTGRVVSSIPALARSLAAQPRRPALPEGLLDAMRQRSAEALGLHAAGPPEASLGSTTLLSEAVLAPWLAKAGMPYVDMAVGDEPERLAEVVERSGVPAPWISKVDHPGAPHRARLGLLAGALTDAATLRAALRVLSDRAANLGLHAARLVVEPMVSHVGMFSLGALRHRSWGPVILVGPGGGRVEDQAARRVAGLLPLSVRSLEAMCEQVALLAGTPVGAEPLAAALLALEALLEADATITEVDVNPVLVTAAGGLIAVDALAVRSEPNHSQDTNTIQG